MSRSLAWKLGVVVLVVALVAMGWVFLYEPIRAHSEWYRNVQADILSLRSKRPPDVTHGQWEYAVGWTINLHGNAGGIYTTVDPAWRDGFATELKRRLQGPITLADIEWIWDEYVAHTEGGQRYSDNYRPTRDPNFQDAQPGCFNMPVK